MSSVDNHGRAWANERTLKPGARITVDGGFTCIAEGDTRTVLEDEAEPGSLYFECSCGKHRLAGQLNDEGSFVGVYLTD